MIAISPTGEFKTGLQENGDFVDLNGEVITEEERDFLIKNVGDLPIMEYIDQIQKTVLDSVITIIQAETGSGKTTQVPKILFQALENIKKMVVTEPRVIAAIAAATRVAKELLCFTLDQSYTLGNKIGFRTGKEKLSSPDSAILYVTDGLQLLRQFVSKIHPDLLIVDEVHTYSVATEFLLAQVKKQMDETKRKIKLVLMSATIDTNLIKNYFGMVSDKEIPVLEIPGRTFPVEKIFRDGDDFIPSIVEEARLGKNVLVFVEGKKQIDKTIEELKVQLPNYNIIPLHSELPIEEQKQVLNAPDKPTIVVATNIAQESITLDYINSVVDNGFCKSLSVNQYGVPELHKKTISNADSMQRAGRAGRVMNGTYIRANSIPFEELDDFPKGEIERITLERYLLIALSMGFDPMKDLKKGKNVFIHNPKMELLKMSYDNLKKLGAITKENELTEIGKELLNYPLDPNIALMLLNGIGKGCAGNMIDICAIINHSGFTGKGQGWKDLIKGKFSTDSDLIALSELLNIVTTREPLKSHLIGILKKEGVNSDELSLYQEFSNNGKQKMLFEIVDLSPIGIKSKKVLEILNTIEILKERLKENNKDTSKIEIKPESIDKIVCSILSGMSDRIFKWDSKCKVFVNDKMGNFQKPINSPLTDLSSKDDYYYTGTPFIIGGNSSSDDSVPLLFFVTKVNKGQLDEVQHPLMLETYKDITFEKKEVGRTTRKKPKFEPRILANLKQDLGGLNVTDLIIEISKDNLEDVIAFSWLPDFLMENNNVIKKYIRSFRKTQMFNKERFKQIITLFSPTLFPRFYANDIPKTLKGYKDDTSVFESFLNSTDPRIIEFRKNPYLKKYEDNIKGRRQKDRQMDLLDNKQKQLIKKLKDLSNAPIEQKSQEELDNIKALAEKKQSVKKIREKQRLVKEKLTLEITLAKEEAKILNLSNIEIDSIIRDIRKKSKSQEVSVGQEIISQDIMPIPSSGVLTLDIINQILDNSNDNISFSWLPDYLICNNQSIRKYLKSIEKEGMTVNIDRLRQIISLFMKDLYKYFCINNIKKSFQTYKFDSSLFESLKNSTDPRVLEFLNNPYKNNYTDLIDLSKQSTILIKEMSDFQRDLITNLRKIRKERALNLKINKSDIRESEIITAETKADFEINREMKLKRGVPKQKIEVTEKSKEKQKREKKLLEMRVKIKESRLLWKSQGKTKSQITELIKIIYEVYDYVKPIREKTEKIDEVEKEVTNEQKCKNEIEEMKLKMRPKLKLTKEQGGITKEDLRKMVNDIKAKYGLKNGKRKKVDSGVDDSVIKTYAQKPVMKKSTGNKKSKFDFMREDILEFIKKSNNDGLSLDEIVIGVEKIEKSFGYKKP